MESWNKSITERRKFNIYETIVKSVMLYVCKTWRIIERSKRALEVTEMDAIRWSMRIFRGKNITNEEIKQRMGMEVSIMNDIKITNNWSGMENSGIENKGK